MPIGGYEICYYYYGPKETSRHTRRNRKANVQENENIVCRLWGTDTVYQKKKKKKERNTEQRLCRDIDVRTDFTDELVQSGHD